MIFYLVCVLTMGYLHVIHVDKKKIESVGKYCSAVWFLCLNTVPDTSCSVVSLYEQSPVLVCPTVGMSIPRRFHRLHPSVLPVCRSGRYGSSRCALADYRFCLFAPAVHSCTGRYTDTGSAVCLRCFPVPADGSLRVLFLHRLRFASFTRRRADAGGFY